MTRSTGTVSSPKKSVLICFSPEDKEGKAELEAHLAAVCSTLTWWSVEEIEAGESLRENFQRIAGKADVALLLLSADFCSGVALMLRS